MVRKSHSIRFALVAAVLAFFQVSQAQTLAFPGVEGFGRYTKGGRGGRVIEVTNLNDNGPGSFREAVEVDSGPRIVVFRVGGNIELESDISITNPYITIAGQTAPGGGIQLKNRALYIENSEVILRHVRVRLEDLPNYWGIGIWNKGIPMIENVVIDHVSVNYASDESICFYGRSKNTTVQWSMLSEGASAILVSNNATDITAHHNLFSHLYYRTPIPEQNVESTNNVIYNCGFGSTYLHPNYKPIFANIVNNYYKEGPSTVNPPDGTSPSTAEIWILAHKDAWPAANGTEEQNALNSRLYISGNRVRLFGSNADSDARILRETRAYVALGSNEMIPGYIITVPEVSTPHNFPPVTKTSAEQAYIDVLAKAGASLPSRDAVDARIVEEVRTQTGTREFTRTWPTLASGSAPTDSDHDGMPDSWESKNGLNPNNASDGPQDKDGDGYTNVEEYLNELAGNNSATAISSVKPGFGSKSIGPRKAKQGPSDIFGRTISENSKNSKKQTLAREIMNRKLGQAR